MKDAKIERMSQMSVFKRCNRSQLEHLAEITDEVTVGPGHVISEQGHGLHYIYFVNSGKADVVIDGQQIEPVGPGAVIGEISMFDQGPAMATVTTAESCDLVVIDHRKVMDALETVPGLALVALHDMARRLRLQGSHS
ncbi:MAG: CRP/FNR family cyclic AMP-dependent transcriptional regulator [Candidatus Poriferisodalaceae bacterium]|jgi:CRP/FNR family cyclic AMP-dependent transcriptional regulator